VSIGNVALQAGPHKGDVFLVEFSGVGGHVQAGRRPAVVVQADRYARAGTVMVCPMTSVPPPDDHARPHRVAVARSESGLDRDGWVKADQVMTLPAPMLQGPIARLAPAAVDRLDTALRFVLDL